MLFKTPPLDIIDCAADMHHHGGERKDAPQFIVLHHTGGWPALNWLTTSAGSNVSSHRYIEPNKPIYKLVSDNNVAYTQGYADVGPWSDSKSLNFNQVCLSIEGCFNPDIEKDWYIDVVWKMACQTVSWWGEYGFLPVVYHWQIDDRKDDPVRFPRRRFDGFVAALTLWALSGSLRTWIRPLSLLFPEDVRS